MTAGVTAQMMVNAGSAGLTSIAFETSAIAITTTITMPTVALGDVAVLFDYVISPAAAVTPSGWTSPVSFGGAGERMVISWKLCDGTESGTTITGMNGSNRYKIIQTFRGNVPVTSVTTGSVNSEDSGNSGPATQTVTVSGVQTPLVIFGADGAVASENLTGSDPWTGTTTEVNLIAGYKTVNSSPSNHTVAAVDGGTNNMLASFYARLS